MKYLFLCIAFLQSLHGASYYVDATGGSDAAAGTSTGAPWQTIAKVNAATFSAGDTIYFKRGETWLEKLTPPSNGTNGNPITYTAYGTGELPIIKADIVGGRNEAIVLATGRTYNTIAFLHCKGGDTYTDTASGLIESDSITNIIQDCIVDCQDVTDSGIGGSSTVRRCSILRADDDGYTLHGTNTGVVENCYFYGNYEAINHSGTDMTLTVSDCVFEHNGDGVGGGGDLGDLSLCTTTFNRCTFRGRMDSVAFKLITGANAAKTTTFNYCVFNASGASSSTQPSINANAPMVFNNCVFYGGVSSAASHGAMTVSSTVTVTNSIIYGWNRFGNILSGALNCDRCVRYEVPSNANSAQTTFTNGFTTDPLFAGASSGNFRVGTGSPAINAGTDVSLTTDKAGRAVANPPDIGAYEYWTSAATGTATSATVSNVRVNP